MNNFWIHPSLLLIGGAILLPLIPKAFKRAFLLAVPLLTFADVLQMLAAPAADAHHGHGHRGSAGHGHSENQGEAPLAMLIPLCATAVISAVFGIFPGFFMQFAEGVLK